MPARSHLPLAAILALVVGCLLAACGSGGKSASSARPAAGTHDPGGGIALHLSTACVAELETFESAARKQIASARKLDHRVTALKRRLHRDEPVLDALREKTAAALRRAKQGSSRALNDAYETAYATENRAIDRYNATVDRLNTTVDRLGSLTDEQTNTLVQYETSATRCLESIGDWNRATKPVEEGLVAAAHATGKATPEIVCDAPDPDAAPPKRDDFEEQAYVTDGRNGHPPGGAHLPRAGARDRAARLVRLRPGGGGVVRGLHPRHRRCRRRHRHAGARGAARGRTRDEAKAQCYAAQKASLAATVLGVPRDVARRVALFSHRSFEQPPEYHSGQCHAGGSLDLRLDGAPRAWSF